MPEATLLAVFLAGLAGGGHCAAMCGGIVGALSTQRRAGFALQIAYNIGRIGSYAAAGAMAGSIGGLLLLGELLSLCIALYIVANILLILIGAYLAGGPALITRLARRIAGAVVLAFGIAGLAQASGLGNQIRRGVLCLF